MSQNVSVPRFKYNLNELSKGRSRAPPRTCLLCYREFHDDWFSRHSSSDSLDASTNQNTFSLFCKILGMESAEESKAWDLCNESLPFCASCNSLTGRLSVLCEELNALQQEIVVSTGMVKDTLVQSQHLAHSRVASDPRINEFRSHVFQSICKNVPPPVPSMPENLKIVRNIEKPVVNIIEVENEKIEPHSDRYNREPIDEPNNNNTPSPMPESGKKSPPVLHIKREESESLKKDDGTRSNFKKLSIEESNYYEGHHEQSPRSASSGISSASSSNFPMNFYKEREFNSSADEINRNYLPSAPPLVRRCKSFESENSGPDPKRKAVFVRDDIEVFEIEDLESRKERQKEEFRINKNIFNDPMEIERTTDSQLRIQRSYTNHFNPPKFAQSSISSKHSRLINIPYPNESFRQIIAQNAPLPPKPHKHFFNFNSFPKYNDPMLPNLEELHQRQIKDQMGPSRRICSKNRTIGENIILKKIQSPPLDPNGEGIHACPLCDKVYSKPYQLKAHLRLHTGEKPYKCNICLKTFRLAGNLRVHVRIHTGETPYECHYCGKRCTQKSQLNTHVLIHHDANGKRKK